MKLYSSEAIRNIALVGHGGCGKTTLADGLLWVGGMVSRRGTVEQGTSVFDYDEDEKARRHSISLSVGYCEWKNRLIHIVDTPGSADFFGEVYSALCVADGAILVVNAATGVEVQSERAFKLVKESGLPCIAFVNKLDDERADFDKVLQELRERLHVSPVLLFYPWGMQADFRGLLDVWAEKAYTFTPEGKIEEQPLPDELRERVATHRETIMEAAAEGNDELLEKYIEGEPLTDTEVRQGLQGAFNKGAVVPVLCGAAGKNIGLQFLLDAVVDLIPAPTQTDSIEANSISGEETLTLKPDSRGSLAALAFKTVSDPYVGRITYLRVYSGTMRSDSVVYNANLKRRERVGQLMALQGKQVEPVGEVEVGQIVAVAKLEATQTGHTLCEEGRALLLPAPVFPRPVMELAVHPKARGDEEKLLNALQRMAEEDGAFKWFRNKETGETIIAGLGDLHLEVTVERIKRKFGAEVTVSLPKIPYKETIRRRGRGEGRYIRQSGGRGQYGVCVIEMEPLARGEGYEFVDEIFGGVIPSRFIPSVEKGALEAMQEGVLAGYPMVDLRVRLVDGKYHEVDSSDIAFKNAGSLALKKVALESQPYLLEPIMNVEIIIAEEDLGGIIGDLNSKRGRIMGVEPADGMQRVRAQVPLAEMQRYAADLRSITRGRGSYQMEFSHYEEVPAHLSEQIIAKAQRERQG